MSNRANAITITQLSKQFGPKRALNEVTLAVPQGQTFGFLGPNGAGKTTTIRCLMGYIMPTGGEATILGRNATTEAAALKAEVGYLSSDLQLNPRWTGQTHIDFMASVKGRGKADKLVKQLDLDLSRKVHQLSSGNKQKLAIILAFLGQPKLLIMDEPTRALDPLLQQMLYGLLSDFKAEGGTVFFSSHNLSEVQEVCDSVAVIKDGRIVAADTMEDLLKARLHTVEVTAAKPINKKDFQFAGAEVRSHEGTHISLKVRGALDPVIKALSKYDVTDLEVTHASLEDIFMEYY